MKQRTKLILNKISLHFCKEFVVNDREKLYIDIGPYSIYDANKYIQQPFF